MDNCEQIYYILKDRGWTTNAICGVLTCIGFESGYNPWRWEGSRPTESGVDSYSERYNGYGLVQWTPASYEAQDAYGNPRHGWKYCKHPTAMTVPGYGPAYSDVTPSNWDGYAQTVWLHQDGCRHGEFFVTGYSGQSYYEQLAPNINVFIASTAAAHDLCETWVLNFERPQYPLNNRTYRQTCADYLWNHFNGLPVVPPDTPGGYFPVWLLLKWRQANMNQGRWY